MFLGSTSPRVTDNQIAVRGLTEGANLCGAAVPVADHQIAVEGLTEGANLRGAAVPVADNQIAVEGLTEGTNFRNFRICREGQANRSHNT